MCTSIEHGNMEISFYYYLVYQLLHIFLCALWANQANTMYGQSQTAFQLNQHGPNFTSTHVFRAHCGTHAKLHDPNANTPLLLPVIVFVHLCMHIQWGSMFMKYIKTITKHLQKLYLCTCGINCHYYPALIRCETNIRPLTPIVWKN